MNTAGCSGWWRICRWTGRFCRRLSQKSSEASSAAKAGSVGSGSLPDQRTTCSEANADGTVKTAVPKPEGPAASPTSQAEGVGGNLREVRISAADGFPTTRRLGSERQANLPPVHRGRADRSDQGAEEDGASAARVNCSSDTAEPMLEHGFRERQAGGWPFVPDSDHG